MLLDAYESEEFPLIKRGKRNFLIRFYTNDGKITFTRRVTEHGREKVKLKALTDQA